MLTSMSAEININAFAYDSYVLNQGFVEADSECAKNPKGTEHLLYPCNEEGYAVGSHDTEEPYTGFLNDGDITDAFREAWSVNNSVVPCKSDYELIYMCAICQKFMFIPFDKAAHQLSSECSSNGDATHGTYCAVCNEVINEPCEYEISSIIYPTCTNAGSTVYECRLCGYSFDESIPETGHKFAPDSKYCLNECSEINPNYVECEHTNTTLKVAVKATTKQNGKVNKVCSDCGRVISATTVNKIKSIKLSKSEYTYNDKAKKPIVTVKDSKGNKISSKNYTVSYPKGRKNVGKYTVTVNFKNRYSGSKKLTFKIKPKKTSIKSLSSKGNTIKVKWKKKTTQVSGYQIQCATDDKFTENKKTVTVKKNSATSKKIKNLELDTNYYVRVRTYKTVNGAKYYSAWSDVESKKTLSILEIVEVKVTDISKKSITVKVKNLSKIDYNYCRIEWNTTDDWKKHNSVKLKKGVSSYTLKKTDIGKHNYVIIARVFKDKKEVDVSGIVTEGPELLLKFADKDKKKAQKIKVINVRDYEKGKAKKPYVHWTGGVTNSDKKILKEFANKHFKDGWSDYQKLNYTFKWIHNNVTYCEGSKYSKLGKYSYCERIFKKKSGQCIDYNGAMAEMFAYLGYQTRLIEGYSCGNNHYWGQVKIAGYWLSFDARLSGEFTLGNKEYYENY